MTQRLHPQRSSGAYEFTDVPLQSPLTQSRVPFIAQGGDIQLHVGSAPKLPVSTRPGTFRDDAPPAIPEGGERPPGSGGGGGGGEPDYLGADGAAVPDDVPPVPQEFRVVTPHLVRIAKGPSSCIQRLQEWWTPTDFPSNQITTSKYTVITFLPVNLFQQFMRVANLYFLFITILQIIPGLSPTSWFTTVFALVIVLTINAVKEGYDDFKRHRSDDEINSRKVLVMTEGNQEVETSWRDVVVGDVVKVVQDSEFPADLLFLSSSDAESICYVETANLDGETNLKNKAALRATAGAKTAGDLAPWVAQYEIQCELPNPRLYAFEGAIVDSSGRVPAPTAVGPDQLLLRGCTLRSVDWVLGVAVFTGPDTKIMMNRTPGKRKVTQLELHMNIVVMIIFSTLLAMSMLLSLGAMLWLSDHSGDWYLQYQNKWPDFGPGFEGWIVQVLRFIILLNGVIPISLYVTLEVTKVLQCGVILNQDRRMYHPESDTPFSCHTTTLNEDLGQVEYVMSDKTGTLTQNVMGFVWVSVAGVLYGCPSGEEDPDAARVTIPSTIPADTPHSLTRDVGLHATLAGLPGRPPHEPVQEFLEHLAVCSTVVPAVRADGRIEYQASSPDEEALVEGAALLGYKLAARSVDSIEVEVAGQRRVYQLLATLEFNSDRKRMSVITRTPEGTIMLFCKGADTMILARVREDDPNVPVTSAHLAQMAQAGYRTLCVAIKVLSEEDYDAWAKLYAEAATSLQDRENKIGAVAEKVEHDMTLLGATAVEDKLQDGVPEAIESLVTAGIRVWVLTGDKVETAISIALSCRLFAEDMPLVELRERDFEAGGATGGDAPFRTSILRAKIDAVAAENMALGLEGGESNVGLVVEGGALALCLFPAHQDDLVALCDAAKSVVCCRVTPMQKALVTRLVRKKKKACVLGIGDGANDVGMIQAAHIGVGIGGREGRAAVLASDFSFAQFRYLTRLLLWHGRSAYKGNAEVIWYTFYKNWLYNLTFVWFAFVNGFSSQPLYTTGLISTFNVCWTAAPIVAFAVLEQDLDYTTIRAHPELYRETMNATRKDFMLKLTGWMILGTWHSLVTYLIPMYNMNTPNPFGSYYDWAAIGYTVYTAGILVINLRLAIRTRYFTWINHVLIWGVSIGIYFAFCLGYNFVWQIWQVDGTADFSGLVVFCWGGAQFWLAGVIIAPALALLPDITVFCFRRTFAPKAYQVFQEWEALGNHAKDRAFTNEAPEAPLIWDGTTTADGRPVVRVNGTAAAAATNGGGGLAIPQVLRPMRYIRAIHTRAIHPLIERLLKSRGQRHGPPGSATTAVLVDENGGVVMTSAPIVSVSRMTLPRSEMR